MGYLKKICCFVLCYGYICFQQVTAQDLNIKGDTIFVNAEGDFVIYFPSTPKNFSTSPADAPYSLTPVSFGVAISAKNENTKPAELKVAEADRNHLFVIVFKKNIDLSNDSLLNYDYKTIKKLKDHIENTKHRMTTAAITPIISMDKPDNSLAYNSLLQKGEDNFKAQNYQAARVSFDEAHALRPDDPIPLQRLEDIKSRLAPPNHLIQKENDTKYVSLTTDAKFYLDQKKYEQARDAFKSALEIRPGDSYAARQLDAINKILVQINEQKEHQESLDSYNRDISQGDKASNNNQLTEARAAFEHALVTKPNDMAAKARLKLIDKKEKDQTQQEELQKNYNAAMEAGDRFVDGGDYASAKLAYTKARELIPGPKPQEQIKKVNDLIARQTSRSNEEKRRQEQEGKIESKYTTLIKDAGLEFDKSNYSLAKKFYTDAVDLRPAEEYPKERLLIIEKILANIDSDNKAKKDSIGRAIIERQQQAKEAEITAKYTAIIKNAEAEFDKSNYARAKKLYADASVLKPDEVSPRERLLTIEKLIVKIELEKKAKNDSMVMAKETGKKYDVAIAAARSGYQKNDLANAKLSYEEAARLKPFEEEPTSQLLLINNKLEAIVKEIAINNNYKLKIDMADSLRLAKDYESAILRYNEAMGFKPQETYPKSQINSIQFTRNREAIKKGDKATADKRWYDAIAAFKEALSIQPNNDYAKDKLRIVNYQQQLVTADSLSKIVVKQEPVVPEKSKKSKRNKKAEPTNKIIVREEVKLKDTTLAPQKNPIIYTNEELKNKYPEFDFSVLPPDQPFNQTEVYNKDKDILKTYHSIIEEQPRLDLTYSDQNIKMISQGINFLDSNIYFKILIQNYSNVDFLTGAMMMTWTKHAGNRIRLYPNHIYPSPLPVIGPGHQAFVIYVCKAYDIMEEESLNFELGDRPKKVVLQLKIPGSLFNREKSRRK